MVSQALIAETLRQYPDHSNGWIASVLGVHPCTVEKVRKRLEAEEGMKFPVVRVATDGRRRRVPRKPKRDRSPLRRRQRMKHHTLTGDPNEIPLKPEGGDKTGEGFKSVHPPEPEFTGPPAPELKKVGISRDAVRRLARELAERTEEHRARTAQDDPEHTWMLGL